MTPIRRARTFVIAGALSLVIAGPASSQATTAAPPVVAGWQDGFFVQSANGDYRLQIGTVVQLDGRFSVDDPAPVINTLSVRKARLIFSGHAGRHFDFRVVPDFGNGSTNLLDAYIDVRFSPAFRVRVGKDKSPVGHEVLVGDAALVFPERALPSSLLPNRDVGVQVQGDVAGSRIFYAAGLFNGIVDGTSSTADVDANAGKDLAGRLVLYPFRSSGGPSGRLTGLGFQIGGSAGKQTGALPSFRTSIGQTYFSYDAPGGGFRSVVANGTRTRLTPAVFYYSKAVGVFAEYAQSTQAVSRGAAEIDVTNRAWNVTAIYNLTGETASAALVNPSRVFDPAAGQWGALQLVARHAELVVDDEVFNAGFAAPGANRQARQTTVGVNWYPSVNIKYYLNFEHTSFDDRTRIRRPGENAIFLRAQLSF